MIHSHGCFRHRCAAVHGLRTSAARRAQHNAAPAPRIHSRTCSRRGAATCSCDRCRRPDGPAGAFDELGSQRRLGGPGRHIKDAEDAAHGYYFCLLLLWRSHTARRCTFAAALSLRVLLACSNIAWSPASAIACALSSAMRVRCCCVGYGAPTMLSPSLDAKLAPLHAT